MSRLAIVFCALAFVSVINATEWISAVSTVQLKTQRMINVAIWEAKKKYDEAKKIEDRMPKNSHRTELLEDFRSASLKRFQEIAKKADDCYENMQDVKSAFSAMSCSRVSKNEADQEMRNVNTNLKFLKSLARMSYYSLDE